MYPYLSSIGMGKRKVSQAISSGVDQARWAPQVELNENDRSGNCFAQLPGQVELPRLGRPEERAEVLGSEIDEA